MADSNQATATPQAIVTKEQLKLWRFQLIDEAKHFYKIGTFWFFIFIGILPYAYNFSIQYGVFKASDVPQGFTHLINILSFLGIVIRLTRYQAANQGTTPPNAGDIPPVVGPVPHLSKEQKKEDFWNY